MKAALLIEAPYGAGDTFQTRGALVFGDEGSEPTQEQIDAKAEELFGDSAFAWVTVDFKERQVKAGAEGRNEGE
jgi:hypothetical protein